MAVDSLAVALFGVAGTFLLLAIVTVALRIYVRLAIVKAIGIDDFLMIAALIFYILDEGFIFHGIYLGSGKGLLDLLPVISRALRSIYFGELMYSMVRQVVNRFLSTTPRTSSVPTDYYMGHDGSRDSFQYWLFLLGFISMPSHIFFREYIDSKPEEIIYVDIITKWDTAKRTSGCLPGSVVTNVSYAHSVLNGSVDLVLATVPIFMVWNLKMNLLMKISIASLLSLGALGGITAIVRIPYLKTLEDSNPLTFITTITKLVIWSCAEAGVGIFVGSIATLRPLFRGVLGGTVHSTGSESQRPSAVPIPWRRSEAPDPYSLDDMPAKELSSPTTSTSTEYTSKNEHMTFYNSRSSEEALTEAAQNEHE
ncbi:hypothetical protein BP6252_05659 [Coleophoma cylindrospora]|uniref:Rhodopsin domain-containing protein n=1 Tax=Coleophoma cylindrospora TaxID=1849047 RepID=A0A3D8RUF2_9HELO|nr:hypothetical protein BP6252_05659 [Coleophoma cylindrospora]